MRARLLLRDVVALCFLPVKHSSQRGCVFGGNKRLGKLPLNHNYAQRTK